MSGVTIAVIGAGMAGLACAEALTAQGHRPILFDKGRGPAGRMATRRLKTPAGEVVFDMGAQYFTVRNPDFAEAVSRWLELGLVAPWPDAGPQAWVGAPSMTAPLKAMAAGLEVEWNSFVMGLSRHEGQWRVHTKTGEAGDFDAVAIALPAEQATPLLALTDPSFHRRNLLSPTSPCWTAMLTFSEPLSTSSSILRQRGCVQWAARNSAKPGRVGPEAWTVHASHDWSLAHLEQSAEWVADALCDALLTLTEDEGRDYVTASAHRWRFALSTGLGLDSLWNRQIRLGVCGDWLLAPRVESAWLSGVSLARRIGADVNEPKSQAETILAN